MFCEKCGSKLVEGAKFCSKCGAGTGDAVEGIVTNTQFASTIPQKKKKKGLRIGLTVVFLALALIGGGVMGSHFYLSKKLEAGNRYLENMEYKEALDTFQRVIDITSKSVDAYMGLAESYIGLDDLEEAQDILRKGFALTSDEQLREKINMVAAVIDSREFAAEEQKKDEAEKEKIEKDKVEKDKINRDAASLKKEASLPEEAAQVVEAVQTDLELEEIIQMIRKEYYTIQDSLQEYTLDEDVSGKCYSEGETLRKVILYPNENELRDKTEEFYYNEDSKLIFAFVYDKDEEYRYYFYYGKLYRYIDNGGNIFDFEKGEDPYSLGAQWNTEKIYYDGNYKSVMWNENM